MIDFTSGISQGFTILFSPIVLSVCFAGLFTGICVGLLPGISPLGGVALGLFLIPILATIDANSPVVFLAGIAYGTLYGRAVAAMSLDASNPTKTSSHLYSSRLEIAGWIFAAIAIAAATGIIAITIRSVTVELFGPAEFASAAIFILLAGITFGSGATASAFVMVVVGLLIGAVGTNLETGAPRFTFGLSALAGGFGMVNVAVGLFVIANVFYSLYGTTTAANQASTTSDTPVRGFLSRATLGVLAGFLPTNGASVTTTAYERKKRLATDLFDPATQHDMRSIFGAAIIGDIRFSVSLIPVMAWLIPGDVMSTVLQRVYSAQETLTFNASDRNAIVWLLCATLISVHIVPLLAAAFGRVVRTSLVKTPLSIVAPLVIALCCVATYWIDRSVFNIVTMFGFGALGYFMLRVNLDRSLLFLAFVLGTFLEENIRRSLSISRGDVWAFTERPIAVGFLIAGLLLLIGVRTWCRKDG